MNHHYPVIILGAGPAGCSASMHLSAMGVEHAIVDKSSFPRDKVCGDALSGKVTSILKQLNPNWVEELRQNSTEFTPSWGVVFSAPDGGEVAVPFKHKTSENQGSPGYIAKRFDFDQFLVSKLDPNHAQTFFGQKVEDIQIDKSGCTVTTTDHRLTAELIISAEGVNAPLAKSLGHRMEKNHFCAGLRQYYSGVKELSAEGYIELHFVQEALPGYFWIFPLPNGEANVGIGMLSKYVSRNKVNLKTLMDEVIASPKFKERFSEAKPLEDMKGWGLPLGSKKRSIQGERFVLTGDAASLIDPFTGEGIGNAMMSGKLAAESVASALSKGTYQENKLHTYEDKVYNKLWGELRLSRMLQRLIRYPWLFNWMIRKINSNAELRETVMFMFEDVNLRKKFSQPGFYLRLLFNRT